MEILAIIPARGGSKGIPNKNIQRVGGKPLITRTIETALKSKIINRLIVSTDDEKIAKISKNSGSEVIIRLAEISNDNASSESALLDVLGRIKKQENYIPDIVVFLQCTSPFTEVVDIDGTINALIGNNADCALAVQEFHHFLWKYDESLNTAIGINHDEKESRMRRQELPTQYLEAGSIYVMRTKEFLQKKKRFFGKIVVYVVPGERVFEIDDPIDLSIANFIASNLV